VEICGNNAYADALKTLKMGYKKECFWVTKKNVTCRYLQPTAIVVIYAHQLS
jgi:hypothetical protein